MIPNVDVDSIYEVPLEFAKAGLDKIVLDKLGLEYGDGDMTEWKEMVQAIKNPEGQVTIGIVGKYVSLPDAYLSVAEALRHGGFANRTAVEIAWVDAESIEHELRPEAFDGILIPGGFGSRGVEGKIRAVEFVAQAHPILGIAGHSAVIEFARNVVNFPMPAA